MQEPFGARVPREREKPAERWLMGQGFSAGGTIHQVATANFFFNFLLALPPSNTSSIADTALIFNLIKLLLDHESFYAGLYPGVDVERSGDCLGRTRSSDSRIFSPHVLHCGSRGPVQRARRANRDI